MNKLFSRINHDIWISVKKDDSVCNFAISSHFVLLLYGVILGAVVCSLLFVVLVRACLYSLSFIFVLSVSVFPSLDQQRGGQRGCAARPSLSTFDVFPVQQTPRSGICRKK